MKRERHQWLFQIGEDQNSKRKLEQIEKESYENSLFRVNHVFKGSVSVPQQYSSKMQAIFF